MWSGIKTFLLGKPLETSRIAHERIPKWKALAVFSSDALSSVGPEDEELFVGEPTLESVGVESPVGESPLVGIAWLDLAS